MKLGLVLGGAAQGAETTLDDMESNARLDQAAADKHAPEARLQAAYAAAQQAIPTTDQAPAPTDPTATSQPPAAATPAAPAQQGALPATAAAPPPAQDNEVPVGIPTPSTAPAQPSQAAPPHAVATATGAGPAIMRAHAHNAGFTPAMEETAVMIPDLESGYGAREGNGGGWGQFDPATFAENGGKDLMSQEDQANAIIGNLRKGSRALKTVLGRDPTPTELYLYHQQGAAAAPALLSADPRADAAQVLVDAGAYKDADTARKELIANYPAQHGQSIPAHPTVGQFLSAWDARVKQHMKGGPDQTPGAPPAPGPYDASDPVTYVTANNLPAMGTTSQLGGRPGVYPSPDGTGDRYSDNMRVRTLADQLTDFGAALAKNGAPDEAVKYLNMAQQLKANQRTAMSDEIDLQHKQALDQLQHVGSVDDLAHFYNHMFANDQHVYQVARHAGGRIDVMTADNDTGAPREVLSLQGGLEEAKARAAAFLTNPGTYLKAIDDSSLNKASIEYHRALSQQAIAGARETNANVDAGVPQATVGRMNAEAGLEDAQAATVRQNQQYQAEIHQLSQQLNSTADPTQRAALTAKINTLSGQLKDTYQQVMVAGQPTTARITPDGQAYLPGDVQRGEPAIVPFGQGPVIAQQLGKLGKQFKGYQFSAGLFAPADNPGASKYRYEAFTPDRQHIKADSAEELAALVEAHEKAHRKAGGALPDSLPDVPQDTTTQMQYGLPATML